MNETQIKELLLLMERALTILLISSHMPRVHRFAVKAADDVFFIVLEQYFEVFAECWSTDNETTWVLLH